MCPSQQSMTSGFRTSPASWSSTRAAISFEKFVPEVRSSAMLMHPPCQPGSSATSRDYDTFVNPNGKFRAASTRLAWWS